jgi:hypothetical protein
MGKQHRRLGRDHDRAQSGTPHDQALIHQDPQRLPHRLPARAMARHQFGLGRSRSPTAYLPSRMFACRRVAMAR